ncbi:4F2 cell-surface antigen heavy chain isoform X1 [Oryzias melastigma]|uniref:Solute carrier family 3 member 2b n=1 Tax=Oryzias melastigma TaxID=30732 RepID=A0A3B3DUP0_ORYME|nr:4F2 cell-surface antigen heavy chain isoform X1 [Oryzias melastigma]
MDAQQQSPVEMKDAPRDAEDAETAEAEMSEADREKEPMTGTGTGTGGADADEEAASDGMMETAAETNGTVKLKVLEEDEERMKFMGLNKEELLRVAGSPGWVRTRWALLLVFWIGWLGMLVGAVLIILQAPVCRELPPTDWWNQGPLLQIRNLQDFSETRDLKGLEQKVSSLSELKLKGLVIGPIHAAPADDPMNLQFEEISPEFGSLEQFKRLLQTAHKKGIFVVLDLTPNYRGSSGPWFSSASVTNVAERLKSALVFWLSEGVDGIQLSGVEQVTRMVPSLWTDIRAIIQNGTDKYPNKRVLIGVTDSSSADTVSDVLSSTGVDLLLSGVLSASNQTERAHNVQMLYSNHSQTKLAWSLEAPQDLNHDLVRVNQLLLMTLPGTPVFIGGEEIGLKDKGTKMVWDSEKELNDSLQQGEPTERTFFRSISELRGKERSLLFGDFFLLFHSYSSLAYLRVWDQNDRFLAAFNWAAEEVELHLSGAGLPRHAVVILSTNSSALPEDGSVDLQKLRLGPGQAALVRFPYAG